MGQENQKESHEIQYKTYNNFPTRSFVECDNRTAIEIASALRKLSHVSCVEIKRVDTARN